MDQLNQNANNQENNDVNETSYNEDVVSKIEDAVPQSEDAAEQPDAVPQFDETVARDEQPTTLLNNTTPPYQNNYNNVYNTNNDVTDAPVWNKVEYTPIGHIEDYRPMGRGLKIFCVIMAAVIALTATTAVGYFLGKSSASRGYIGNKVEVDLAARPTDTDISTPAQVYEMVNQSVVGIRIYNEAGDLSDASGVIYSEDGYIVTNDHIYSEIGAAKFKVFTYDGTEYDAVYVAGDSVSDLAVLKIENGKKFKVATFGDSETLINGEPVVAVGRPSDATDNSSITSGIISLTSRRVKTTSSYTARLIQTDSAINPGSSGGALVNMYGQVVGITSSKLAGVEYDAIGFAIPTKTMKRVVEQLIADGKVTDRAKLGITYTELNSVTAEIENYASVGLLVVAVGEDSDIFGKVGEGDIITHVNGTPITNDEIVLDVIEDSRAGDSIELTVLHSNGNISDYVVKLRANISESSYSNVIGDRQNPADGQNSQDSNGGIFDFPYGE